MVRKQVYLDEHQEVRLKHLAKALRVSEAALIRQSLDRGLLAGCSVSMDRAAWQAEKEFIRRRMRKGPLAGKRTWKREDIYER